MQIQCCRTHTLFKLPSTLHYFPSNRKVVDIIQVIKDDSTKSSVKRALLVAKKKEKIKLPSYENANAGEMYHISQFLKHPTGVEAMLNVNALESYVSIDVNTYRHPIGWVFADIFRLGLRVYLYMGTGLAFCSLFFRCKVPPIQLLNFEVAPVLDLEVSPASECCTVELLSCKFQGSPIVEDQNKYFSATMTNFITWEDTDSESFLDVDVKLNITLEIYNRPFTLLPVSTVEKPGNLVLQALLDRVVPLLLQQLLQDYDAWVRQQRMALP